MISNLKINSNKKRVYIIAFLTLLTSLYSSNQWSDFPIGNEVFWWTVQIIYVYLAIKSSFFYKSQKINKNLFLVKLYLFWIVICIFRGIFVADNYWEWKFLISTSFFLLLPFIVYLATDTASVKIILKTWFKYSLFIFVLISPFLRGDAIGKFLIPFATLLLFFPILNFKWKIITLSITVFVLLFDISARSNLIKFVIPFLIGLLFYLKNKLSNNLLNSIRIMILVIPIVLLLLASSKIFNVFKLDEYIGEYTTSLVSSDGEVKEENLTADTRTFLYIEVIESALKNEYVFFGRTPARGNDSSYFGGYNKEVLKTGKSERFANEVSILNIFTWLGIIGAILYFMIFIKATYLAVNQSNNIFIKLIGINVSFRWTFGFVEDISSFDLSNIFLWLMIGMCFSESFRKMNNRDVKNWVRDIFDKKKPLSSKMIHNHIIN